LNPYLRHICDLNLLHAIIHDDLPNLPEGFRFKIWLIAQFNQGRVPRCYTDPLWSLLAATNPHPQLLLYALQKLL